MASRSRGRKSKTRQLRLDSMTGVNPVRTHGLGIWGNPRVVMSVRVDEKLKEAFTSASKALFGSTCNPIESYMATIVGLYQNERTNRTFGVNPSITVDIGEIKIERNLRERRKLTEGGVEETENNRCTFAGCKEGGNRCPGIAVASARYRPNNKKYYLCVFHFSEARKQPRVWELLSVEPT